MKPPEVAGELYANRLRKQVVYEWQVPMPCDDQISAVLHALADLQRTADSLEARRG